jgi:signal transduction histidine kinase
LVNAQTWVALAALVACATWTALILRTPTFRFIADWPSARVPIETASALVAGLVATLAYFRYAYTGVRSLLFVALAFIVLAMNQFVFGVVVSPDVLPQNLSIYVWASGRLIAATLLLAGTLRVLREPAARRHPFLDLLAGTVAAVIAVGVSPLILSLFTDAGPSPLQRAAERAVVSSGGLLALSTGDLVLGLTGAAILAAAAFRYALPLADREPAPALLAPALVLAAFSQIHYMLMPTVFSDAISTGDLLRVAFYVVVFCGLVWEVRTAYLSERHRAVELENAFFAEQRRAEELERLDRARADLVRLVTHELMHPVAAVRGWIVTLERRWDELDDGRKLEIVSNLDAETRRLRDLAEQAPEATEVASLFQPIFVRRTRVTELVDQAMVGAEDLDGRLEVHVDRGVREAAVRADSARVLQVLRNLLSNAARHGGGSPVELSVLAGTHAAVFEVTDAGPGIMTDDLPHIFERGYRANGAEAAGAGLGLYICKGIVEALGGSISAESLPGVRTTFRFSVPWWEGS